MLHGSFWMIAFRWSIRLIGLVSTIILARLLAPSDFGIVAMAMFIVGMLEVLNQTGQRLAIIRLKEPSREDYDTAWTISVMLGSCIALAIILLAPLSNAYFHEPRAVVVMRFLALRAFLGGLENIGTVDFRRDIRYDRFYAYGIYPKLISFVVTITLAWILRSYWALVAGIITGQLSMTVLSYIMHPYRPRFTLAKISNLLSFSSWTFMSSLGLYINQQVDQVVVGGLAGASWMGRYAVASDVSGSPSQEINAPMVAVLFPVMAKLQGRHDELRKLFLRTLAWSAIICTSTSVGVTLVAPEMVRLVLGDKWQDVVPLMGWLALSAGTLELASCAYVMFTVIGLPQLGARMQWLRLVLLIAAIVPVGYITHNVPMVAATRLAITVLFLPTLLFAAGKTIHITPYGYLEALWRPFAAAAIMAAIVKLADAIIPLVYVEKLILDVAVGGMSFAGSLISLWVLSGRPETPEGDIVALLQKGWKRLAPSTR